VTRRLLTVDLGTTTIRAMVIGEEGEVLGRGRTSCPLLYPAPGLVEQDPEAVWSAVCDAIDVALDSAGVARADLAGIGITGQRATLLVWERATASAIHPLVSWQDMRGAKRAAELQEAGFLLSHMQPACKLESVLDTLGDARERMQRGEVVWGDIETYLVARLSGGALHVTDASLAQATAYFDYETGGWDARLLELQGLDAKAFPTMLDSQADFGTTSIETFGAAVPMLAMLGDQQSACFAQGCRAAGDGKITFGTSATANVHTGHQITVTEGGYPALLWRLGGSDSYAVEGMVLTAGATFEHLVELGVLDDVTNASALAASVEDAHGVFLLPALQGLGSPFMDPSRVASIHGMTRGTSKAHVVRAATEGVAFRVRQVIDNQFEQTKLPLPAAVRVDGGAAANDTLMQTQANVLGKPVERMAPLEATAHGVGMMAGIGADMWDETKARELRRVERTFEPQWSADERQIRYEAWKAACGLGENGVNTSNTQE
jgi:glycerol kinase